ncbi:MAG: CoA transferase, partial [Acidimicrobiia bacterium]
ARTAAAAWATLDAAGVPCEIASDRFAYGDAHSPGIHDDPEMARLGLVVTHTHPKVGTFEHFGRTLDFHGTPTRVTGPPPVCGAHTREILVDSGFTDSEISTLLDCGAVFEEFWVDTV